MQLKRIVFCLILFLPIIIFAQKDSIVNYRHSFGISVGIEGFNNNFNQLKSKDYMLNLPFNFNVDVENVSLYYGNPNKVFGSVEFSYGNEDYSAAVNLLGNVHVWYSDLRGTSSIYYSLHYKRPLGLFVYGSYAMQRWGFYSKQTSTQPLIFENSVVKEFGILNFGFAINLFKERTIINKVNSLGCLIKIGYNIPVIKEKWEDASTHVTLVGKPSLNFGGPTISIALFSLRYDAFCKKK